MPGPRDFTDRFAAIAAVAACATHVGIRCRSAVAENSALVSAFAQATSGHYCSDIKAADLRRSELGCVGPFAKNLGQLGAGGAKILETMAFGAAAPIQIAKDRCLAERARALMSGPPKARGWWQANLAKAWLGRRKAQLTVKLCDEIFDSHVPASEARELGVDAAWERWKAADRSVPLYPGDPKAQAARESKFEAYKNVCFDPDAVAALKQADELFAFTVTVVGSDRLFDDVGRRRDLLVDYKTRRPLTDPDILALDMRHLESMQMNRDPALDKTLAGHVGEIAAEREKNAMRLERARRGETYELSAADRQYLYDEGTVTQALRVQTEGRADAQVPAALACLSAKYGAQPAGELFDFAVWSALTGGAFGLATGELRLLKMASTLARLGRSANAGMGIAGGVEALSKTWRACTGRRAKFGPELNSIAGEIEARDRGLDLPGDEGFSVSRSPVDPAATPSCRGGEVANAMVAEARDASCAREILTDALPNLLGLPR